MEASRDDFFGPLVRELGSRAALATVSQMGANSAVLREHLVSLLSSPPGSDAGLLAEPVFENMFEWDRSRTTIDALGLLHPTLVANLATPYKDIEALFPSGRLPYVHQVEAWRALLATEPKSVVVRTGTSSGKTEAFLVPILDDLTRELEAGTGQALVGTRALFLYPLNALINSQKDRLLAGTAPYGARMRFCLYNGNTPHKLRGPEQLVASEVRDRALLRESPPPILVTNATMLEYLLVRKSDAPILDQSQGQLRWVVLDEAHTYLGTAAAELALLIRRVLHAFGVEPSKVRFVATSATIGGEETERQLGRFLADLAGIDEAQVAVIGGKRVVPELPPQLVAVDQTLPRAQALRSMPPAGRASALASSEAFRELRARLGKRVAPLREVAKTLGVDDDEALELLDLATQAGVEIGGSALLPVRGHFYQRTQPGLWACTNPTCDGRPRATANANDWHFGRIYLARRDRCSDCQAMVGELVLCNQCGESYTFAHDREGTLSFPTWPQGDGFDVDDEDSSVFDDDDEEEEKSSLQSWVLLGRSAGSRDADGTAGMVRPYDPQLGTLNGGAAQMWLAPVTNAGLHRCGNCGEIHRPTRRIFRGARLGVPFYLRTSVQTIAEHVPATTDSVSLPAHGRRFITFTDSRQGTATHALSSQLQSERMWTRSAIYHQLWDATLRRGAGAPAAIEKLQTERDQLRAVCKSNPGPVLESLLAQKEEELRAATGAAPTSIPWRQVSAHLAGEMTVFRFMADALRSRYAPANLDANQLAEMCLLREFLRRPARLNSMETLGLAKLTYPGLAERVSDAPSQWLDRGHSRETWLEFLSFTLDFFVRAHTAIEVSRDVRRWLGLPFSSTLILQPGEPNQRNVAYPWPSVTPVHVSRVPRTLMTALRLNRASETDRQIANALLQRAWLDVTNSIYLAQYQHGFKLQLQEVHISPVDAGWLCPTTGRVVAHTVLGFSPFGQDRLAAPKVKCKSIAMPKPPRAYPSGDPAMQKWLQDSPDVQTARALGIWSEFSDRIALFDSTTYLQSAEHSAQVERGTLDRLEASFKKGAVNVLHCSTTMEMGVDIGGLSSVLMNNVPPAPANYVQRAGRAGRRGETRAAVVTMCSANAHGAQVFRAPLWPFETAVRAPKVALTSERIVQRHLHSFLLGCFLRSLAGKSGDRLDCREFFLAPENDEMSLADRFASWMATACEDDGIAQGMKYLTARTPLVGQEAQRLEQAREALATLGTAWSEERQGLLDELTIAGADETTDWSKMTAVQKAIRVQLKRHDGEFLLGLLASRGFLPAYGFPLSILPLVTTTAEELEHERKAREEMETEQHSARRSFPTRGLERALTEYAPGRDVVINGVVRESRGVALTWRMPAGDKQGSEPQSLRYFWRCDACGDIGDARTGPSSCPSCGADKVESHRYLEPAGFAVDIRSQPKNTTRRQPYLPGASPIVAAAGAPWRSLPTPSLGSYRTNADGWVFHRVLGEHNRGYVVCRHCGRADALERDDSAPDAPGRIPSTFARHQRLRGGKAADSNDERRCHGALHPDAHGVWKGLALGGANRTDVFELMLRDPADQTSPLGGAAATVVATSLAVAMREGLARDLGIDPRELGWSVSRGRGQNKGHRLIALYDTADGGAGYCTQATDDLARLIEASRAVLQCPKDCDTACHACLLAFDTQRHVDDLDRRAALAALSAEVLASLRLPDEAKAFGDGTQFEPRTLADAFQGFRQRLTVTRARIYWGAKVEDWDWHSWPIRKQLIQLAGDGARVEIVISKAAAAALNWQESQQLARQVEGVGFRLRLGDAPALEKPAWSLALELEGGEHAARWAVSDPEALSPGDSWGSSTAGNSVRVTAGVLPDIQAELVDPKRIEKAVPGTADIVDLDLGQCALSQFGVWFAQHAVAKLHERKTRFPTGAKLARVRYSDRYLRSPLVARLLRGLLGSLKPHGLCAETQIEVRTMVGEGYGTGGSLSSDWTHRDTQQVVIELDLAALGCHVGVHVAQSKKDIGHERVMTLEWENGEKRRITFDQGLGFVRAAFHPFKHAAPPVDQAAMLASVDVLVRGNERSRIWVETPQ